MALGDVIARLSVVLGMETAAFEQGATIAEKRLAQSQKRIEKFGDKITGVGARLSVALSAPLAALGKASVDGFIEQQKAIADVEAALASMGDASGKTAGELSKAADALELNSLFDAEVILKQVSAQLLTFGNIAGEQFDRAQQAAVDMATRLGGEPQAAAIALGKALNDPIRGVTALTRVGVQFTDQQKAQIAAMQAAGDVAGAQGVILAEVEKQFRGAAAAAADASPWRKAQVAIGQAMDTIGAAILPAIAPIAEAIASIASAFANMPEPVQKAIVVVGALAAALGPVLIVAGSLVSAMAPLLSVVQAVGAAGGIFAALKVAVAGLAGAALPLAAAIAAVYLAWKNWDKIAPVLQDLWEYLQSTFGPPLRELLSAVSAAISALWNGPLGTELRAALIEIVAFSQKWSEVMGPALLMVLEIAAEVIAATMSQIANVIRLVTAVLSGDWKGAWQAASAIVGAVVNPIIGFVQGIFTGVKTWLQDKLGGVLDWVMGKIRAVEGTFAWLYDRVVGNSWIPDMVVEVGQHMNKLDALMVDPARKATAATNEAFRALASDVSGLLDRLFPEAARLKALREDLATIDAGEAAGLLSGSVAESARYRRRQQEHGARDTGLTTVFPGQAIPVDVMRQQMNKFLQEMGVLSERTDQHTVRIATSFKDMATETLNALERMTSAIKGGGFLDILGAVLNFGLQLGSIGVFGKKVQGSINKTVPGYAVGTNSAQRGLALVGERGPELVSFRGGERVYTNAQTRGMMGGRGGGNSYHFTGNLMTPEFWAQIQAGDQAAAANGASLATSGMARARKWSLS